MIPDNIFAFINSKNISYEKDEDSIPLRCISGNHHRNCRM